MTIKPSVATTSGAYNRMAENWPLIDAVMGGTKTMRAAGKMFLPQHPAESEANYEIRRQSAILPPFYRLAVSHMTGRVFSKPLALSEEVPERLQNWLEDADMTGRNFNAFARDAFFRVMTKGIGYILIDFPPANPNATVAEEELQGVRPYFVFIPAEDMLAVQVSQDGRTITQARIRESVVGYDGFSEKRVDRIRVLTPGMVQVYEETGKDGEFAMIEERRVSLPVVPIVPVYSGKVRPFESVPPLLDLAHLNVNYYRSRSNHENALSVAQFPMLAASGYRPEDGDIAIGPKKFLKIGDPAGKFYYVEHSGAAINCGRQHLEDIQKEIALLGLQMLMPKSIGEAAVTATEQNIKQAESNSDLEAIAYDFADALEQALFLMGQWVGEKESGSVVLHGSFGIARDNANEINALIQMNQVGKLSDKTLYAELKRRGVLADAFDADTEMELLLNSAPDQANDQ